MEKKPKAIMLGLINPEGYELDNRVYFRGGISPTQRVSNAKFKVIKKWKRKQT